MNNVVLIGRLTKDPELRYTTNGTAVTRFTLAVEKNLSKDKKEEMEAQNKPTADFIRVVTWNKTAEAVGQYTAKGKLIAVNGRIQTGSYQDDDGKMVYTTDVVAHQVKFLEWKDNNQQNQQTNDPIPGFEEVENENIPF